MKTYIIIGAAGGYISGAPIYHRNKALYLRDRGWTVYYISCCGGHVYVRDLEQFIVATCSFLCQEAYMFSRYRQKKLLDYIVDKLPAIGEEVVIETGTYYTAYWGELLSQYLKAKHVIVYLDEHNDGISDLQADFFKFKYGRNELACITRQTMLEIFSPFWYLTEQKAVELPCCCTNSLEDYDYEAIRSLKGYDCSVGYIGRLEKDAMKVCLEGVIQFASLNPQKEIAFICLGGAQTEIIEQIKRECARFSNITLFVSGYIFPIPLSAVRKCNVVFASAGSVYISVRAGVPTVRINVYTNQPDGFVLQKGNDEYQICSYGNHVIDYLNKIFVECEIPEMKVTFSPEGDILRMNKAFDRHLSFLYQSSKEKRYYDFSNFNLSRIQLLKKTLIHFFGMRTLKYIK